MIKVTVSEQKPQSEKPFPKLMISKKGTIIFFHKPKYGFVIQAGENSKNTIESDPKDWAMELFTDFNETITLQNA